METRSRVRRATELAAAYATTEEKLEDRASDSEVDPEDNEENVQSGSDSEEDVLSSGEDEEEQVRDCVATLETRSTLLPAFEKQLHLVKTGLQIEGN